jgi:uncharacterized protein YydD (DUF2326 family)
MIHRLYSSLATFKTLEFRPGFNLLISERHQTSTDLQTRNRAGKSSFVQAIHFLLGSNAGPDSIFRKPELVDEVFGLDFDLHGSRVVAERRGKTQGRTTIVKGVDDRWPIRPSSAKLTGESLSTNDWRAVLGTMWFGLPVTGEESYQPTFRSLFSYFARREGNGGLRHPEMQSSLQQVWDQQLAVAYLLDLDWRLASEWQKVRDREKTLRELRKAASEGAFGEVIPTSAQLRTQLVVAERASRRLQESLATFEVLPEYRELESEASTLTQRLSVLADENLLDRELLESVERAMSEERTPDASDLQRLYEEAGVVFPEAIKHRFDEVRLFHDSVVSNRRQYLESERVAADSRISLRAQEMARLDKQRGDIMRTLRAKGALDQFQRLQQEAARQESATEMLRQRFQAAEQLEGVKSELDLERGRLLQRLRRDLAEQHGQVDEAIAVFEEISSSLYEEAGSLTLIPGDNGLKVEIQIQGDRSRGIQNMQVFCFDMMLMQLSAKRGFGPGFLIHDSHLFDGVDERQVGKALSVGAALAERVGWQYIVTMNEDDIPRTLPVGFDLREHVLPVKLTDEQEDGGLFGIRF